VLDFVLRIVVSKVGSAVTEARAAHCGLQSIRKGAKFNTNNQEGSLNFSLL
jgi:hypothetical protein